MLNTATSLISDVIGNDHKNSAFVYGCYSLFDKFANGTILFIAVDKFSAHENALRWIMSGVPISCAILGFILTVIGKKYYGHKMALLITSMTDETEDKKDEQ